MNRWRLAQIAEWTGGKLVGGDIEVCGISTDTRQPDPKSLFVAIAGPHYDAHDFIHTAAVKPLAAAVMVHREISSAYPQVVVGDTLIALKRFASAWRSSLPTCLVAITGSNGKTTVKNMLTSILSSLAPTSATQGNLNNQIGVPLTLLEVSPNDRFAVVEMGANHPGEIAGHTVLASPQVALVNNVGPAHLEGFEDLAGIARAKGEIFSGLSADGVAVINADDPFADYWRKLNDSRQTITFGLEQPADICGHVGRHGCLLIQSPVGDVEIALPVLGCHNVMNAMAACAAALAIGVPLAAVRQGLMEMRPAPGRLTRYPLLSDGVLLDDSYNANPASLAAGLAVLADQPQPRWLVLGDMAELGESAQAFHHDAARIIQNAGVERIYAIGPLTWETVAAFGPGACHFDHLEELNRAVRQDLAALNTCSLLVKGSRSMGLERLARSLLASTAVGGTPHAV